MTSKTSKGSVILTLCITPLQHKVLNKLVKFGISNSRSELMRRILDRYMYDIIKIMKVFEILTPEQIEILGD